MHGNLTNYYVHAAGSFLRRVCSLGPEFSQILWNPNIPFPSPKIQSNPPSLNEKNPFYICPYHFFKMPYDTVIHPVYNYFLETIPVFHVNTSPNPQSGPPLSSSRDCLFHIFAATLHIGGRPSIRNLSTRHAVSTSPNPLSGPPLSSARDC